MKICEKCGAKFKCGAEAGKRCWCQDHALAKRTLRAIRAQYSDCLCRKCLAAYAKDKAPRSVPRRRTFRKKGLVLVYTGGGKGKSTAAFGTALRVLGHGDKVAMVQFLKGKWKTGEEKAFKAFGRNFDFFGFGEGFTWETKNFAKDVENAREAWAKALELIGDDEHRLVICDEINYVLQYNFLDVRQVVSGLRKKPPFKHVILTGNGAPEAILRAADLVSEVRCVKHPYQRGISAQPGIEY
ncbi:MAG: cob(I)yrinic acid a,c-diamide adenosyltransferase [Candidatus Omnitrophota bacterium]|jgi:cob(I)alamin adenosyltransferase